jgi:drug/metabolite transporter (DMT)-like permease
MQSTDSKARLAPAQAVSSSAISFGLLLMVIAVMLAPVADVFSKLAVGDVPAVEIGAARFLIQMIAMVPMLIMIRTIGEISWNATKYNAARGFFNTISMIAFVTALKYMEVSDAVAIFFVEPIILTVMSAIFLKERIGIHRISACVLGFVGTLIVVRPSFAEFGWVAVLPIICAFGVASNVLISRIHSQRENPWAMQFQSGFWGLIFCLIAMAVGGKLGWEEAGFVIPYGWILAFVILGGLTNSLSGLMSIYAAKVVPGATLAPLQYFEIFSATLFGWLIFNHFPDAMKWVGISLIIASGLYIIWRERKVSRQMPVSQSVSDSTSLSP